MCAGNRRRPILIDLIRNRIGVNTPALLGNQFQFLAGEHLAGGVVRRVHNHRARVGGKGRGKFLRIERPIRRTQPDVAGGGAANDGVGPIVLIEGLKDHNLIARVDNRQQGGDHGFRGTAANRHLPFGVNRQTRVALETLGDSAPEFPRSPGNLILVNIRADSLHRCFLDLFRGGKVRESLGKIYSIVLKRQAGHFPNHRLGKLLGLLRDRRAARRRSHCACSIFTHTTFTSRVWMGTLWI